MMISERALLSLWLGVTIFLALLGLSMGFLWHDKFAGDAIIHFSIFENAAQGRWFQFNPGVPSASSTSMLWTMLGAAMWRAGGVQAVVFGVKGLCFLCWLANSVLVFLISRALGVRYHLAVLAGLVSLVLPGSLYNTLLGMENALFTTFVLGALLIFSRSLTKEQATPTATIILFFLCSLAILTRPEGVILATVLGSSWVFYLFRAHRPCALRLTLLAVITGFAVVIPAWWFYYIKTGHVIPSSGISRMMMARRDAQSIVIGGFWIYLRPLIRQAAYLPLFLGVALILGSAINKDGRWAGKRLVLLAAGAVVCLGLFLYVFITGAHHTSRYFIWLFAIQVVLTAVYADHFFQSARRRRLTTMVIAMAALMLFGAITGESALRMIRFGRSGHTISEVIQAPRLRQQRTARLLEQVCKYGCCKENVIPAVAFVEVQQRFFLDERISITSVDGCTTGPFSQPVQYLGDACPDFNRLLKDPAVVALGDNPGAQPGNAGALLGICMRTEWLRSISTAWGAGKIDPAHWNWEKDPVVLVRTCR